MISLVISRQPTGLAAATTAQATGDDRQRNCGYRWASKVLWGDLKPHEAKKYFFLAIVFFFIVGTYWLLRSVKDAVFMNVTGKLYIPQAKMASFCLIIPLVMMFSKLVDVVERHKIFYIICGFYCVLLTFIAYALSLPDVGLENKVADKYRLLGWISYLTIESFGSLCMPAFWSFVNSIADKETARSGYRLIIWSAQIGAILGPVIASQSSELGLTVPYLFMLGSFGAGCVPMGIFFFMRRYPKSSPNNKEITTKEVGPVANGPVGPVLRSIETRNTGVLAGVKLLMRHWYLVGVLAVATLYEVVNSVIDFQLKVEVQSAYNDPQQVARYFGGFGIWVNSVAFVFSFVGTSAFIKYFGLTGCLVFFALCVGCVCIWVWLYVSLDTLFYALVLTKGLSYALNTPCKEMLYLPTSKDVKFKTKAWIDMFGTRLAKMAGSFINVGLGESLLFLAGPINLTIVVFWVLVALWTGRENARLNEMDIRLGEEEIAVPGSSSRAGVTAVVVGGKEKIIEVV